MSKTLHYEPGDRVVVDGHPGVVFTYNADAARRDEYLYLVKLDAGHKTTVDAETGPVRTEWFRADQLTAAS